MQLINRLKYRKSILYFFILPLVLTSYVACTPFKMGSYTECEQESDCIQHFERCDIHQFCVTEESLCYWQYANGEIGHDLQPAVGQNVIGVLANPNQVNKGSERWSALVGLLTGADMAQSNEALPPLLMVCNQAENLRTQALSAFTTHDVHVIIGQPLPSTVISSDHVYISIGLDDSLTSSDEPNVARDGWLNLRPSKDNLHQAFELFSGSILENLESKSLVDKESGDLECPIVLVDNESKEFCFLSLLSLQQEEAQASFIQNIIWRLSPYETSLYSTLMVFYDLFFNIDLNVKTFLGQSYLNYFISVRPTSSERLLNLLNEEVSQSPNETSTYPMNFLSLMWDVTKVPTLVNSSWPEILSFSVIYGQYAHLTDAYTTMTRNKIKAIYDLATTNVTRFDPEVLLPTPYFGLAFDAGVLAVILNKFADSDLDLHPSLNNILNGQGTELSFTNEELTSLLSDEEFSASSPLFDQKLLGMTGYITNHNDQSQEEHPPQLLCSKNGLSPIAISFQKLSEPVTLNEELNIKNHYSITESFTLCEGL